MSEAHWMSEKERRSEKRCYSYVSFVLCYAVATNYVSSLHWLFNVLLMFSATHCIYTLTHYLLHDLYYMLVNTMVYVVDNS